MPPISFKNWVEPEQCYCTETLLPFGLFDSFIYPKGHNEFLAFRDVLNSIQSSQSLKEYQKTQIVLKDALLQNTKAVRVGATLLII